MKNYSAVSAAIPGMKKATEAVPIHCETIDDLSPSPMRDKDWINMP